MTINQIQDWWNTLEEAEMRKVYQGQCKHNYIVQQVEGNLFCTKCQSEITIDISVHVFNYMHEIKEIVNG